MSNIFCHQCGNKLPSNAKFCTKCGRAVEVKESKKQLEDKVISSKNKKYSGSWKIVIWFCVIVLIFLFFLIGGASKFLQGFKTGFSGASGEQNTHSTSTNTVQTTPINNNSPSTATVPKKPSTPTAVQNPTSGQSYFLQHGAFSAFFPEEPTLSSVQLDFGNGNNVQEYIYDFTKIDKSAEIQASYAGSAIANVNTSPEDSLKNEVTYTDNTNGFKVISSNITSYDNFPAINYLLYNQTASVYLKGMDIAKGNDIYSLDYQYPSGKENKTLENSFFNSLTFSPLTQSVPEQTETQNTQTTPNGTSDSLSSSLINQIEPTIVEINCWSAPNYTTGTSGSGESFLSPRTSGTIDIVSNYHVLAEAYVGTQPPRCYATYPELPDFNSNFNYGDYQLTLVGYKYNPNTYEDEALFTLGNPLPNTVALNQIPTLSSLPLLGLQSDCTNVNVGDKITIFGYPMSGNALEISETVTQGIISGILPGPIFKTDAPIDHGNSGGIAIRDSDACILGIPTLGVSGLTAGIGYIQSTYLLNQPTN
jgi:hypothetical protein